MNLALKTHKRNAGKADQISLRLAQKRDEISVLLQDVKGSVEEIGRNLKDEQALVQCELNLHRENLSLALGKDSDVKGFDTSLVAAMDDSLDHLDIYAEFLGEKEFIKAKENYERTLSTME